MCRKKIYKNIIIILLLFNCNNILYSQDFESTNTIKTSFLIPKFEVQAKQNVFNILTVKNTTSSVFNGYVTFDVPEGWDLIGENNAQLNLEPGDSINFPVRVLVSAEVLGEVAYVIIANIIDNEGRQIKAEYCFVSVPRLSGQSVKVTNQMVYFDQKTDLATLSYTLNNKGNVNEIFNISLSGPNDMAVNNSKKGNSYTNEVSLPPYSDTTIYYSIAIEDKEQVQQFYNIDLSTKTQDSVYKSSIWLNRIDNAYYYQIPEENKCAVIELTVNDLMSYNQPSYSLIAYGAVLFKRNTELRYFFMNSDIGGLNSDNWQLNTKAFINFENNYLHLKLGTNDGKLYQNFYGIGAETGFKYRRNYLEGFYLKGIADSSLFYGGFLESAIGKSFNGMLGYGELDFTQYGQFSKIAFTGFEFLLFKYNRFSINATANNTDHFLNNPFNKKGIGILFNYNLSLKKLNINANIDYGSPDYTGISKGRLYANNYLRYNIGNKSSINLLNSIRNDNPAKYVNDVLQTSRNRKYNRFDLYQQYNLQSNISLLYGARIIFESSNMYTDTNQLSNIGIIASENYRFFASARIYIPDYKLSITPRFDIGNIFVIETNSPYAEYNEFTTSVFSLNIVGKYFGFFTQYRNGPYDINEQYLYNYERLGTKRLFIMPYYDRFFFKRILNFSFKINYQNNSLSNYERNSNSTYEQKYSSSSSTNLATQFAIFLRGQFSIRLMHNFYTRTYTDETKNSSVRYNSSYLQLGVKKEFSCNQPRVKYYDLKVNFYRDLNGNRKREENEPGINNVLVNIDKIYADSIIINYSGSEYSTEELLSDEKGLIEYTNIPDGEYNIRYMLIGNIVGNFSRNELSEPLVMDQDRIVDIPYSEYNKIIGSIVLSRDPLSSLGPQDISNIRVVAEDTKGNTYSALSDKDGNFVLYTPVADHYIVRINNVMSETFDLQQKEYIVKFNGYKQFKVTFVFSEKKRKINFDTDITKDEIKDDLKVIRKTTLAGRIEHQISLQPVEATVKIIDNTTNKVVSETSSNSLSGNYSISYAANDNYRIVVEAPGYQMHEENLYYEQIISIQNFTLNIGMKKVTEDSKDQNFIIYDKKQDEDFTQSFKSGQKIPINNLNFDEKESRLSPEAYPELDRLIEILSKNKSVKIEVAGHADDTGTDRIDNLLAMRRAIAVQKYLISHGLTEDRIVVKSYSNSRPLVPGTSEKAKQKNRRVEITVL
jgi:outer membrane protein OmpA-like peptidoglycan-associated protein